MNVYSLSIAAAATCTLLLGHSDMAFAATKNSPEVNDAADIEAVRQVGRQWQSHYQAGRLGSIPELYTKDTIVMPRGRPRIEGREAMRRSVGRLAAGRKVNIDITEREIYIAGNVAWFIGDFKVTYTSPESSTPPTVEYGRSLILFRRDNDGQWRIHRDMDSPAPEPSGGSAAPPPPAHQVTASPTPSTMAAVPRVWDPAARTEPTACDRLTSSRYDRTRLAPPVDRASIDVPAAIRQCELDLARFPNDARIHFQLGRIYGYAGDQAKTLAHRRAAAAAGNHNAIFLLGFLAWSTAKNDQTRCSAASDMRLAADRGNYSAQLTYSSLFLEGKFSSCPNVASDDEVAAYVKAARPAVDGFFETRLADHLAHQINQVSAAPGNGDSKQ